MSRSNPSASDTMKGAVKANPAGSHIVSIECAPSPNNTVMSMIWQESQSIPHPLCPARSGALWDLSSRLVFYWDMLIFLSLWSTWTLDRQDSLPKAWSRKKRGKRRATCVCISKLLESQGINYAKWRNMGIRLESFSFFLPFSSYRYLSQLTEHIKNRANTDHNKQPRTLIPW